MAVLRRRRTSLWDSIREAPRDWLMQIVEDYELVDWNKASEATSWPIALILNGLYVLTSMVRQISSQPVYLDAIVPDGRKYRAPKVTMESRNFAGSKRTWSSILLLLQFALFMVSVANAWRYSSSRRIYQMRMKDEDTSLLTSNCRRVSVGTRRPGWANRWWGWGLWALWKWVAGFDDKIQGEIWELALWMPSTFSRNLFCWYSPVQLLILSFMNGSNWYYILPLAAAVACQCTYLVFAYTTMVKDKQILFGEVYNEYNQKFVNPRVFAPKRDAATSTMEDWSYARRSGEYMGRMPMDRGSRYLSNRRSNASVVSEYHDPVGYYPGGNDMHFDGPMYRRSTRSSRSSTRTRDSGTSTIPDPFVSRKVVAGTGRLRSILKDPKRQSSDYIDAEDEFDLNYQQQNVDPSGSYNIRDRSRRRQKLEFEPTRLQPPY
ncbi:hypothetical protein FB645_001138 [Coemansia sp. IMI 203386]|nr:hypothetical protein FB645_001138 [Coemansia sp. IMI 203386]